MVVGQNNYYHRHVFCTLRIVVNCLSLYFREIKKICLLVVYTKKIRSSWPDWPASNLSFSGEINNR